MAFGMFCTIPLPSYWDNKATKFIMPWFPVVGVLIGIVWWLGALGLQELQPWVSTYISAVIFMIIPFVFTGFIHLDGYMDTSDAILSRRNLEDKLRILKDSSVGAFSVIMLVLLFVFLFASSAVLVEKNTNLSLLIIIPILSRSCSALGILSMRPLTPDGYASLFKPDLPRPQIIVTMIIAVIAVAFGWFLGDLRGLIVAFAVVLGYGAALLITQKSFAFRGISGDLAGFSMTISELTGLLALAVI